jgi:hypothetical protein
LIAAVEKFHEGVPKVRPAGILSEPAQSLEGENNGLTNDLVGLLDDKGEDGDPKFEQDWSSRGIAEVFFETLAKTDRTVAPYHWRRTGLEDFE